MKKRDAILVILGILFISFNLRAPITAVGSIVEMIQLEYSLSNAVAGFITTLPLLAFAIVSPFVARISNKLGRGRTMMAGLFLILVGEILRSYTGSYGLFIGTGVIGIGIAIGNVLIPGIIKLYFPSHVGLVTSIYTSGMCIFAAVGAGISLPIAKGMNLGWKNSLASWFILTVVTALIWLPQVFKKHNSEHTEHSNVIDSSHHIEHKHTSIWSSPLAWWVTLFMGIQSLIFYSLVAWLPTIIISKGMSEAFSGNMALLFQLMAIPATLVIPSISDKFRNQKGIVGVVCAIYAVGMTLFMFASNTVLITVSVVLMSIGMGGSISLSIAFISMRSPNSRRAAELSGMSQSAGYLLAALGPIITGAIFDLRGSWVIPEIIFISLIVVLFICGLYAGSDKTVKA